LPDRLRFAAPAWRERLLAAGVDTCGALRGRPGRGAPVAESRTSRTDVIEVDGILLHRKVYTYPRRADRWRAALRGTFLGRPRAVREWDALMALRADGLPAVEPVALGVERHRGFVRATVLATRTETDATNLDELLRAPRPDPAVLARAARVLARVHAAGHVLGRPARRDVLVVGSGSEIRLLDLPRHRRARPSPSAVAEDLARLAAGLEDRVSRRACLRALAAYVRARGWTDVRDLVRRAGRSVRRHEDAERARSGGSPDGRG
jgi:hypothetical protein